MIYKQKRTEVQGLWCRANKTFYYLETGVHSVRNPLDRIKGVLMTKGLLEWSISGTKLNEEPIKKMSWADAEERGYAVQVLYLNAHVQKMVESGGDANIPAKANPWKD
jgi:hypothetical protein